MLNATTMTTPRKAPPAPRAPQRSPRKAPTPPPTRADGRPKSKLTLARERGALEAGRAVLLDALTANDWNLTETARALDVASVSQIIRAIREHGLEAEYKAARASGKIAPGPRPGQSQE